MARVLQFVQKAESEPSGFWSEVMGTCEVCRRLEGNQTPKRVKFCRLCKAWICEACWDAPLRRARAAVAPGWELPNVPSAPQRVFPALGKAFLEASEKLARMLKQ